MKQTEMTYTPLSSRMTYRVLAYVLSFLTLVSPVMPSFGAILNSADVEQEFNQHPLFQLLAENTDYQYTTPNFVESAAPIGMNMGLFFEEVKQSHPDQLGEPTFIPIAVGDITTFIPVNILDKRIGTHAVQSRYIRSQINALLGRTLIDGGLPIYSSEAAQLDTLYTNAEAFFDDPSAPADLIFGQPLGWDQRGEAPMDMVWPELRTINNQEVLVPVVYLSQDTIDTREVSSNQNELGTGANANSLTLDGASIKFQRDAFLNISRNVALQNNAAIYANGNLNANIGGSLVNSEGSLIEVNGALVVETNGDLTNGENSSISVGDTAMMRVGGAFNNLSAVIETGGDLTIGAQSIGNKTLVHVTPTRTGQRSRASSIASIDSNEGHVVLRSYGDLIFEGATASAGTEMRLAADGSIWIGSAQVANSSKGRNSSYTRINNIQSSLSADDMLSLIANGQIVVDAAELVSDEGHIELLAGMGITIEDDLNVRQHHRKWKHGKNSGESSGYRTIAMRALLDAGKGIRIHSDFGDITLRAADISSKEGTNVNAAGGAVNLQMTVENDHYSYSSVKKGLMTVKTVSRGHQIETGVPNTIIGGLEVEALQGVSVEYEGDPDLDLDGQIGKLSEMPGLEWLATVKDDHPNADWTSVGLIYKTWDKSSTSLSPAAIALISIAVAIATGGAGVGFAETIGATTANGSLTTLGAAVAAGTNTLISQAVVALANGAVNGDITGAMEDLLSEDTLKNVAVAMVTAGAIHQLDAQFFDATELNADSALHTTTTSVDAITGVAKTVPALSLTGQALQVVTHSVVQAGVQNLAYGGSFEDSFMQSLASNAINTIGEKMANKIGDAKKDLKIGKATQYIAHAALGCVIGSATAAAGASETEEELACASGAGGAVIGEFVAQQVRQDFFDESGELIRNKEVTVSELSDMYDTYKQQGVNLAKLSSALVAFAVDGDVSIAAQTGENAAANNAFWFLVIPAVIALEKAWTAYEYITWSNDLAQAVKAGNDDEVERLLREKATEVGIDLAVGWVPGGKTVSEIAQKIAKKLPDDPGVSDELLEIAHHMDNGTTQNIVPGKYTSDVPQPKMEHHIGPNTPVKKSTHTLDDQRDALEKVKKGEIDLEANGNTIRKGNFGEMAVDDDMVNKGFTPIHERITDIDKPLEQGIDGIFEKDGKYYIVESKFGSSKLAKGLADGTDQMDSRWIRDRINSSNTIPNDVKLDILDSYVPVVARVNKSGGITYKKLNDSGRVVRGRSGKIHEI